MTVLIDILDEDRVRIDAGPRYGDLIAQIPGARHNAKAQHWSAPLSWGTCLAARGIFGAELEVGEQLNEWAAAHKDGIARVARAKNGADVYVHDDRLFPEQIAGASFLLAAGRALLADDMRVGKTVQTIAALRLLPQDAFPVLIVCPNSMKFKWAQEIAHWAPELSTSVITGTATQRRKAIEAEAAVSIINWESLKGHSRLAPYGSIHLTDRQREPKELNAVAFGTVIVDEAHRMKDPKSQQTRAAWAVLHAAKWRFALTGTPIANDPADLWAVMHGLVPHEWPSRNRFIDRYALSSLNHWGGLEVLGLRPETKHEFYQLLDPRFLRRTKEGRVTPVLDPRPIEMSTKQRKAYDSMAKDMISVFDSGLLVETDVLVRLGRLRQIACAMLTLDDDGNVVGLEEPSCKVDGLLEVLDEQPGEPLVVFAESRKLIELCARVLERKKISHVLITGAVQPAQRAYNVEQFQAGEAQVALCTIGAGAEGITLNRADRCLFLERSWSMVKNKQAQARIDPIGEQTGSPVVIDLITIDSVEASVHAVGETKGLRLDEITRDRARLAALIQGRAA